MDKLAKLGKGGKAVRTLEKLGYIDDAMATVADDLTKLTGEVKTVTKVADTAEDLTNVAGKVKKVTKADELSEASKALAEGGEAAGKGSVVEEVVSRSGLDSIIKNGKVSIDDLKANPSLFSGKSVDEIAQALTDAGYDVTVKASIIFSGGN